MRIMQMLDEQCITKEAYTAVHGHNPICGKSNLQFYKVRLNRPLGNIGGTRRAMKNVNILISPIG